MGLDYEWTAFADEELAIQAILSGQMDIGFGTPYAAMQKSRAPIRIIFQLSKLKFFPVTSQKYSKLEDLDGEPIMLHSRGGGTDSIANMIENPQKMSVCLNQRKPLTLSRDRCRMTSSTKVWRMPSGSLSSRLIPPPKRCANCSDEVLHGNRSFAVYMAGRAQLLGTQRVALVYAQDRQPYDDPDTFIDWFIEYQLRGDDSEFKTASIEREEFFQSPAYERGYRKVLRTEKKRATLYSFRDRKRTILIMLTGPASTSPVRSVGRRSTWAPMRSVRRGPSMRAGQRTRSGVRIPPSYTVALRPWKPDV